MVSYCLSKGFVVIKNNSSDLKDVPLRVKQLINAENIQNNDTIMMCYIEIPSTSNTLKIITICSNLLKLYSSMYYNDNSGIFNLFSCNI